ncbi:MAG: cohesin domain-containing protein [Bellilinea sp.]
MKFNRRLFTLLLSVCLSLSAALPARAQSSTTLSVTPAASEVLLNDTATIRLYVTGGVEINAFDVAITYHSQKLTLESWSYGNYLSGLARVYMVNQPGEFRVAATQLAKPGVSGEGTLLIFNFKGVSGGVSPITITAATIVSTGGMSTTPSLEQGTLTVVVPADPPTETPVPTPIPTATLIPTSLPTEVPSPKPTLTQISTRTPTAKATATKTFTATVKTPAIITATATKKATMTATATKKATKTATIRPTAAATSKVTATATKKATMTATTRPTSTPWINSTEPPGFGSGSTVIPPTTRAAASKTASGLTTTPAVLQAVAQMQATGATLATPTEVSGLLAGTKIDPQAAFTAQNAPNQDTSQLEAGSAAKLEIILTGALILLAAIFLFMLVILAQRKFSRNRLRK